MVDPGGEPAFWRSRTRTVTKPSGASQAPGGLRDVESADDCRERRDRRGLRISTATRAAGGSRRPEPRSVLSVSIGREESVPVSPGSAAVARPSKPLACRSRRCRRRTWRSCAAIVRAEIRAHRFAPSDVGDTVDGRSGGCLLGCVDSAAVRRACRRRGGARSREGVHSCRSDRRRLVTFEASQALDRSSVRSRRQMRGRGATGAPGRAAEPGCT